MPGPFDSAGMDRAMSDARVERIWFEVPDPSYRGRKIRTVPRAVWERGRSLCACWRGMGETGDRTLNVGLSDGRTMTMPQYLETEAANAVPTERRLKKMAKKKRGQSAKEQALARLRSMSGKLLYEGEREGALPEHAGILGQLKTAVFEAERALRDPDAPAEAAKTADAAVAGCELALGEMECVRGLMKAFEYESDGSAAFWLGQLEDLRRRMGKRRIVDPIGPELPEPDGRGWRERSAEMVELARKWAKECEE